MSVRASKLSLTVKVGCAIIFFLGFWQVIGPGTGKADELYQTVPTMPPPTNTARPTGNPSPTATVIPTGVILPTATTGLITLTQPAPSELATEITASVSPALTTGEPPILGETSLPETLNAAASESVTLTPVDTQTANQPGSIGGAGIALAGLIGGGAVVLAVVIGWLVWRKREKQG